MQSLVWTSPLHSPSPGSAFIAFALTSDNCPSPRVFGLCNATDPESMVRLSALIWEKKILENPQMGGGPHFPEKGMMIFSRCPPPRKVPS